MKTFKGRGRVRPGHLAVAVTVVMIGVAAMAFVGGIHTVTATTTVSFSTDIVPMFAKTCTLCHGGESPSAGLNLEASEAYGALVGVQARPFRAEEGEEAEFEFFHVTPGMPEVSYLLHKSLGTQATVGGRGAQMPRGLDPWTAEEIDLVRQWILAGAPDN